MNTQAGWFYRTALMTGVFLLSCPVVRNTNARETTTDAGGRLEASAESRNFPSGRDRGFYWEALRNQGYRIIDEKVNLDSTLVLAAAKPNQAIVLTVQFDESTGKSNDVVMQVLWSQSDAFGQPSPKESDKAATFQRQQRDQLAKQLQPGRPLPAYREQLANLGWRITSVNNDEDDFVEYEVVKDEVTYEIQFRLEDQQGAVTQIDVRQNTILAPATKRALARQGQMAQLAGVSKRGAATTPWWESESSKTQDFQGRSFSDRYQTVQMVKQLNALPTGHDKQFYWETLKRQDYRIIKVNTNSPKKLTLHLLKQNKRLALIVSFDPETGKSTAVEASRIRTASQVTNSQEEKNSMKGSGAFQAKTEKQPEESAVGETTEANPTQAQAECD